MNIFAKDIKDGLSHSPKKIPSKYFYDDNGSRIFQQIMEMPEYYLTNSEHEILSEQSDAIFAATKFQEPFQIIELGAGDGAKTKELLAYLLNQNIDFTYVPIDISQKANDLLSEKLHQELPGIKIKPETGDYFKVLERIDQVGQPRLLLFLGANIGNYSPTEAQELIRLFHSHMHLGDNLLIGFDIQKNPNTIALAYNDPAGITRNFNLNLLKRINRELGGDFDLDQFDFYSHYNPHNGEIRSFLVSLKPQEVYIESLDQQFEFDRNELIYTELSKKYSTKEIREMAQKTGFKLLKNFWDSNCYFVNSLWEWT